MKYTALKAHVYSSHISPVSQVDDTQRSYECDHVNCNAVPESSPQLYHN